jgi:hypothetical protein
MSVYRAKQQLDGALAFGTNALVASGAGAWLRVGQAVEAELAFGD